METPDGLDGFGPTVPSLPAEIPSLLPVLPLRDLVVFPHIIVPLTVSRDRSVRAVEQALKARNLLLLLSQRDDALDSPAWSDLHRVGTVAMILRMLRLPDGRVRILVQGVGRGRVEYPTDDMGWLEARVAVLPETGSPATLDVVAAVRSLKNALQGMVALGKNISSEVMVIAANLEDPGRLADLTAANLDLGVEEAQRILELEEPVERLRSVLGLVSRETALLEMQQRISSEAKSELDRGQREYYLRQQLRAIEKELGEGSELQNEVRELRGRVEALEMPAPVREDTLRHIEKLQRMQPDGAETAMLRSYLDWVTTLPWGRCSPDRLDLKRASRVLESDHHGLKEVKDRILDFLAVRKLRRDVRGPILCFVGPPGVGKTSLGQAIARALGRSFVRASLGGVRDEAEIRGHRRTYVGAMPGRIIQGIHQAGTSNPVFLIDEVDKIGADFRGDPSSALLEVLDPAQNHAFRDHYLNVPYDLSQVLFLATANLTDPIHPAFRDRMEVLNLEGYTEEEKVVIARRHLLPRLLREHGLSRGSLLVGLEAILQIVRHYTREAGLRGLERELGALCRRRARELAEGKGGTLRITPSRLARYLGQERFPAEDRLARDLVGIAQGLAWTASGGEILTVEALLMEGQGKLILTGHLGTVMQESAQAALSYLKARAGDLALDVTRLAKQDVHVHVPEGAIPKDGPSAGLAMLAALGSALSGRPVRRDLAMTGEITLRGSVLAVGGIRQKAMAARRAGLGAMIVPERNRRDVAELPETLTRGLAFHFVGEVREALELVLGARAPSGPGRPEG